MNSPVSTSESVGVRLSSTDLDNLTQGAFSAQTSGERMACVRTWLATQPAQDVLQQVFRELSAKDKGAAKLVRERLDDIKRSHAQAAIAQEWADKAQALLALTRLNVADAMAWQRDAARAGAPLSREPLADLKVALAARVGAIEDLQHRVQVQREAAVLAAQRIEVLSTKPWSDALAQRDALCADVQAWQAQAQALQDDVNWPSVDLRLHSQLSDARAQLVLVWDAFDAALTQTQAAAADASLPLPAVPVWADAIRALRGVAPVAAAEPASPPRPKADPALVAQAAEAVSQALATLEAEMAQGHGKASASLAQNLRGVLREHARLIDPALETRVNAALAAEAELEGWQRWRADQLRQELVTQAQALLNRPEGQALGGRKMQEQLKALRERWKTTDQGGVPNHGLWRKFDEACNAAHQVVQAWLEQRKAESDQHRAQRLALIAELLAWGQGGEATGDWRAVSRSLHAFSERWRNAGHLPEKLFADLQAQWKMAMDEAAAPFEAARAQSLAARHALIEEAQALGQAPRLMVDAVKALQARWQAEAQRVPLDRRQEQKLWDAFRKPIDEAFARQDAERARARSAESEADRAVLDAARAVQQASAAGDAQAIRLTLDALQRAMSGAAPAPFEQNSPVAPAEPAQSASDTVASEAPMADAASAPVVARKPVVAVRGDDRPGSRRDSPAAAVAARPQRRDGPGGPRAGARPDGGFGRDGRGEARGGRDARPERPTGSSFVARPRLGDAAFRAQRDAFDAAQSALRGLAAQAHGESLTRLLTAWTQRSADLPSAQELGAGVSPTVLNQWRKALTQTAGMGDAQAALLRLELAAEVPSPAEHIEARRRLQLELLTRRHASAGGTAWTDDVAQVLSHGHDADSAQRLQRALKVLLRGAGR